MPDGRPFFFQACSPASVYNPAVADYDNRIHGKRLRIRYLNLGKEVWLVIQMEGGMDG
ncbi:MAG: hypothetical protein LVQ95_01600 [Candidatus Micrarchaeales archaeon]|nr:hypothetical protein [Candidatus Micrarchaeales archaeon]